MTQFAEQLGIRIDLYSALIIAGLIFTRLFVMFQLTPFLGGRAIPGRARIVLSLTLTLFLYPLLVPPLIDQLPENKGLIIALFFKEIFFGFSLGLVTTMVFYALEAAGRVVDHQRGGGNAEIFLPQLGQVSIFGLYNFWLAVAFFLAIGGHRLFLKAVFSSFETVPLLDFPALAPGFSPFLELIVRLSGDVLIIAMQLAAPVIIAVLLVDLVLGIANKMAPQINVFELGFAVKGYIAPVMLYVSVLILVTQMEKIMEGMVKSVYQLSAIFGR
ncbi:MAG: flagellar biosynthetic protein FliR [Deltaproteobacteria bacterium]|nr:flagellar biosynthetic protein FliR [Deltaproteobacteria bacterium]